MMKNCAALLALCVTCLLAPSAAWAQDSEESTAFTVSMEPPSGHYYHVVLRCTGLKGRSEDFKMPAWTPGYYKIVDYARNVLSFRAEDGQGRELAWAKTAKNTWRVQSNGSDAVTIRYDVYAYAKSVADSYLDDDRAFISPTGVFMYPADRLRRPVTVTVERHPGFTQISTGLDRVIGQLNQFSAPDFDVLYDGPILVGNQELLSFEVRGIPHRVAMIEPGEFDRGKFTNMLQRVVEAAVSIVGDIPYRHYTFLLLGEGQGGLEHLNSMAVFTKVPNLDDPNDYRGWLRFLAHEFFHLYNVKTIRPIALGPFDYDKENYTNLLWLSEGGTVYYESLICNRAGLLPRDKCLEQFQESIRGYEGIPGHRFQSAAASSFDVWLNFFRRGGDVSNTTISYYDKGAALTMLLDLKIRHETKNQRSFDDVMRTLYERYYKQQNRGFTDQEFREVCEEVAGCPLPEVFRDYACGTEDIDYVKYLAYAGLEIDTAPKELPGARLGAEFREDNGRVIISNVEWDSSASRAGLSTGDEILALDGLRASSGSVREKLDSSKPGDKVHVLLSHNGVVREVEAVLDKKTQRSFAMTPMANPDAQQSETLREWLKDR
jgi:predicted metalloprotease with PDZ domain